MRSERSVVADLAGKQSRICRLVRGCAMEVGKKTVVMTMAVKGFHGPYYDLLPEITGKLVRKLFLVLLHVFVTFF